MLGRFLRWLRGPSASSPPVVRTRPAKRAEDVSYRHQAEAPGHPPAVVRKGGDWRPVRLVPDGLLTQLEVFALQKGTGILHLAYNDVVLARGGLCHLLEHEGCVPIDEDRPGWPFVHRPRVALADPAPRGDWRRLTRVMGVEVPELTTPARLDECVERPGEPAVRRDGARVDLAPALLPDIVRVVRSGDAGWIGSLLGLLDLLARFDGHEVGEIDLLPLTDSSSRGGLLRVGLGEQGAALLDERVDDETRARLTSALGDGRPVRDEQGAGQLHAVVAKSERLNGSSGHRARLCFATLTVSPGGFVYEDEVLWSELDPGIEYS